MSESQSQLADKFMSKFTTTREELSNQIQNLNADDAPDINEKLTSLSNEILKLSKDLHDAIMYLPSYSVKMRQNEIRDLEKLLKEKEDLLVPKKKFGFRSKLKAQPQPIPSNQNESEETKKVASSEITHPVNTSNTDNYFTIESKSKETVKYGEPELNGNDVLVKDCEDAVIILEGGPSTLRLANLKNCHLLCGPVRTSVFVDNVFDSVLFLCCQQLRTHSSEKVDIYLRVGSRAIIEDCKEIRFGPYKWDHAKSDELHKMAQISSDLERYDAVDDFNWLSHTPSPHWCRIPPEDIISFPLSSS